MRRALFTPSMGVALVALVVAASGGAYAATHRSSTKIVACIHHRGGGLYVAHRCARHDHSVSWNVAGVAGARGAPGAPGQPGAKGDPGVNGTNGVDGAPATRLFAQVTSTGKLNAGSPGVTATAIAGFPGTYFVVFAQDITHCGVAVTVGGIPNFATVGAEFPRTIGYADVDIASAGTSYKDGPPTANAVSVETFDHTGAAVTNGFYIEVFC